MNVFVPTSYAELLTPAYLSYLGFNVVLPLLAAVLLFAAYGFVRGRMEQGFKLTPRSLRDWLALGQPFPLLGGGLLALSQCNIGLTQLSMWRPIFVSGGLSVIAIAITGILEARFRANDLALRAPESKPDLGTPFLVYCLRADTALLAISAFALVADGMSAFVLCLFALACATRWVAAPAIVRRVFGMVPSTNIRVFSSRKIFAGREVGTALLSRAAVEAMLPEELAAFDRWQNDRRFRSVDGIQFVSKAAWTGIIVWLLTWSLIERPLTNLLVIVGIGMTVIVAVAALSAWYLKKLGAIAQDGLRDENLGIGLVKIFEAGGFSSWPVALLPVPSGKQARPDTRSAERQVVGVAAFSLAGVVGIWGSGIDHQRATPVDAVGYSQYSYESKLEGESPAEREFAIITLRQLLDQRRSRSIASDLFWKLRGVGRCVRSEELSAPAAYTPDQWNQTLRDWLVRGRPLNMCPGSAS